MRLTFTFSRNHFRGDCCGWHNHHSSSHRRDSAPVYWVSLWLSYRCPHDLPHPHSYVIDLPAGLSHGQGLGLFIRRGDWLDQDAGESESACDGMFCLHVEGEIELIFFFYKGRWHYLSSFSVIWERLS